MRRVLELIIAALIIAVLMPACIIDSVGGAFHHDPEELDSALSPAAKELIVQSLNGIPAAERFDYHVHLVGLGTDASGAEVHPAMHSWLHPVRHLRFATFASAAGVTDFTQADQQYIARLVRLMRQAPRHGRSLLLAFDHTYDDQGNIDREHTDIYVPNEYVVRIADQYPDLFVPAISVHPYRADAVAELRKWAERGVRFVKWLPNAMGIDPSSERCVPFYEALRDLNMILLSHGGDETSMQSINSAWGNPLLLRQALDHGATVIVAHCASDGTNIDWETLGSPRRKNLDLFLRLLEDPKYQGRIFGDISAIVAVDRVAELKKLLSLTHIHDRLVNGSDYPVPAINAVVHLEPFVERGLITAQAADALREIYRVNPWLFDFVLKRTLKHPETGRGFPKSVFLMHRNLQARR